MEDYFIKERNPEYVFRGWQDYDRLWRGSFYLNGKWYFDDCGYKSRRALEMSLEIMGGRKASRIVGLNDTQ